MKPIIVITGQTGTGKTMLALKLAQENNGELVNADSRQIYKYLDIITGKDIENGSIFNNQFSINQFGVGYYDIDGVKLWLYDAVDPKENFTSQDFVELANRAIVEITSRGKVPIVVGGSYFYIKHLLYGFDIGQIPPDWRLRDEYNDYTVTQLQEKLLELNGMVLKTMNNSDQNNPRRLIRKIEIELFKKSKQNNNIDTKKKEQSSLIVNQFIGLRTMDNDILFQRIKNRVEERVKMGAFEEVESLLKRGYTKDDPGLQTIGYKQIINYFEKKKTKQIVIDEWILREIQYAKRQYTFMKKDENLTWQDV